MNFLAHTFLTKDDLDLMVGNYIADFIRGKKKLDALPEYIKRGITLHRAIDKFTDSHPVVKKSYERLKPSQGRYASVLIDVMYDYFLVKNWNKYSEVSLEYFTQMTYKELLKGMDYYPDFLQKRLPMMIADDWLTKYGTLEGQRFTFERMSKRVTFENHFLTAVDDLVKLEEEFNNDFNMFFPDLIDFTKKKIIELKKEK